MTAAAVFSVTPAVTAAVRPLKQGLLLRRKVRYKASGVFLGEGVCPLAQGAQKAHFLPEGDNLSSGGAVSITF